MEELFQNLNLIGVFFFYLETSKEHISKNIHFSKGNLTIYCEKNFSDAMVVYINDE